MAVNLNDNNIADIELGDQANAGDFGDREAFLGLIVATMREGVWFLDADGITTYVNRSMASILGWSEAEMQGRSLFDFMDEKAVEQAGKYMDRRRSGISEIHEFRFRHRDGSDVWTTLSTRSLRSTSGQFLGTMATIQDITPQKKVEAELRSRKQQLRQMLDQLPLMTWSVDSDLRVTSSYGSALKRIGLENDELVGISLQEYFSSWEPDKAQAMLTAHQRAVAGETVFLEMNFLQRTNFNIISPYYGLDNSKIIGAIGVALDVTDQVQAQQQLEKSENLLRSILKSAPDAILTVDA
ncbi:MAG: PAS domain-containing protein, partial [bacterium]